jgi:hypothetical protein
MVIAKRLAFIETKWEYAKQSEDEEWTQTICMKRF